MSCDLYRISHLRLLRRWKFSIERLNFLSIAAMQNQISIQKRLFLEMSAATATCLLTHPSAYGQFTRPIQKRLWLIRKNTGEEGHFAYWENGNYLTAGYKTACHLLRDTAENSVIPINTVLLEILHALQNWLASAGIERPIVINSGYRTRKTNNSIEGAARSSMHLSGKAADISIPDIPTDYLAQLATLMRAGGVGFYPSKGFVHVDCGSIRNWQGR